MAGQSNRAMRPFWMHQLVEYVIGASFISTAIASSTPVIPIALGVLILVNAAVAIGPAGAFRVVHRQVHRIFDLAIMGLIVFASIQPVYDVDNSTRALMLGLGLVMAFVWWNSDFATRDERKQRRRGGSGAARAAGQAVAAKGKASPAPTNADEQATPNSEQAGRNAGRSAAQTYLAAKRLKKAMIDDRNKSDSA